jgi:hypothetical protein
MAAISPIRAIADGRKLRKEIVVAGLQFIEVWLGVALGI